MEIGSAWLDQCCVPVLLYCINSADLITACYPYRTLPNQSVQALHVMHVRIRQAARYRFLNIPCLLRKTTFCTCNVAVTWENVLSYAYARAHARERLFQVAERKFNEGATPLLTFTVHLLYNLFFRPWLLIPNWSFCLRQKEGWEKIRKLSIVKYFSRILDNSF